MITDPRYLFLDPLKWHIGWTVRRPSKTNPVLLVHANTVLAGTITGKGFWAIPRRHPEVFQGICRIQQVQLANGDRNQRPGTNERCNAPIAPVEEVLRSTIAAKPDHHYDNTTELVS